MARVRVPQPGPEEELRLVAPGLDTQTCTPETFLQLQGLDSAPGLLKGGRMWRGGFLTPSKISTSRSRKLWELGFPLELELSWKTLGIWELAARAVLRGLHRKWGCWGLSAEQQGRQGVCACVCVSVCVRVHVTASCWCVDMGVCVWTRGCKHVFV